jgi:hypothetical protein
MRDKLTIRPGASHTAMRWDVLFYLHTEAHAEAHTEAHPQ